MRKLSGIFVLLSLLTAYAPLPAQTSFSSRKKTPRAVAVLDFDNLGRGRLLPVSLFMDGKFYDAGLYMSKPAPVVLNTDTVYEAVKSGVPQGLFTVEESRRADRGWWGVGKWKPYAAPDSSPKDGDSKSGDKPKSALKDDEDPDRPVLKKSKTDDGSVTVQTGKGKPEAVNGTPHKEEAPAAPADDDPDRPRLSRVRPVVPKQEKDEPIKFVTKLQGNEDFTPAISDSEPLKGRPYAYVLDDSDRQMLTLHMKEFAAAELRKTLALRHWPLPKAAATPKPTPKSKAKPGKPGEAAQAPDPILGALTDVKVSAYDLDYNNSPQIILTARYMPPTEGLSEADSTMLKNRHGIAVALVGRVNFDNVLQQIFAAVSDPRQLEERPELTFVDAVDVDGDGRAELLFQRITGDGRGFVIYRVAGASMGELFATTPR